MRAILLFILVISPALSATVRAAPSQDLLAHGSSQRFWIALFETASGAGQKPAQTTFYLRAAGDSTLQRFSVIDGRAVALAHRGTQLAALLGNGDWILASESGGSSEGPTLPGGYKIVRIVGGDDSFHALGLTGVPPATTAPATAPTTAPAQIVGARLVLTYFALQSGKWKALADLPADTMNYESSLSLAIIDRVPTLALMDTGRSVRLLRFDGSAWNDFQSVPLDAPALSCQLLEGTETLVLWAHRQQNSDSLEFLSAARPPRNVPLSFIPASAQSVSVAYALGQIRVLWFVGSKLQEQDLDPANGRAVGGITTVELPEAVPFANVYRGLEYAIWSALFLAILGAMRWRRVMQGMVFDLDKLQLAPLPRRFCAGVIDLFPIIIGLAVLEVPNLSPKGMTIVSFSAGGFYLLYMTISEMLTATSLGKWLLGLSVVGLDGDRPTRTALLIRNLLRLIDLGLGFVPLIVVFVSPLRQRTGDVAAGTLVVRSAEKT